VVLDCLEHNTKKSDKAASRDTKAKNITKRTVPEIIIIRSLLKELSSTSMHTDSHSYLKRFTHVNNFFCLFDIY